MSRTGDLDRFLEASLAHGVGDAQGADAAE